MSAIVERARRRPRRALAVAAVAALLISAAWTWWAVAQRVLARPPRAVLGPSTVGANLLAFSPDGKTLAVEGHDWTVRLWGLDIGKERERAVLKLDEGQQASSLAFSHDGATLSACVVRYEATSSKVLPGWKVWDVVSGRERPVEGTARVVRSLRYSDDGRTVTIDAVEPATPDGILTAGTRTFRERIARLYAETWRERSAVFLPLDRLGAADFSPDASILAGGRLDGKVTVWDATTGRALRSLDTGQNWLRYVRFSPDGRTLALGFDGGRAAVQLWDVASWTLRVTINGPRSRMTYQMAFSPDSRTLATTYSTGGPSAGPPSPLRRILPPFVQDWFGLNRPGSSMIFLWDAATGRRRARWASRQEWVSSLAFSPDGRTLAAGSPDRGVMLWDIEPDGSAPPGISPRRAAAGGSRPGGSGDPG